MLNRRTWIQQQGGKPPFGLSRQQTQPSKTPGGYFPNDGRFVAKRRNKMGQRFPFTDLA